MPISDLQAEVLRQIAANRSPDSYLAGATVLNRAGDSPRYSQDLDLFHDAAESVALSAETDAEVLRAAGHEVEWLLRTPAFYRAVVTVNGRPLRIEWAQDSAFRFFPVQKDPRFGFRLHDTDAATNKLLALAGRSEVRDFVDVLHLHDRYLSLGALVWAACGKDAGYTPELLLEQVGRHSAYTQADLDRLLLREPLDATDLKGRWLTMLDEAHELVGGLPPEELGCLYLSPEHEPVSPAPDEDDFPRLTRHHGSIRGAWPVVSSP